MRAKLTTLNHCAVPFLSRAAVNLSWYDSLNILERSIEVIFHIKGFLPSYSGVFCISNSKTEPLKGIEHGTLISFVAFIFVIGIFVTILGCLGCFGSITQSPRTMSLYLGLMAVILILELAAFIGVFAKRNAIKKQADEGIYDNTVYW